MYIWEGSMINFIVNPSSSSGKGAKIWKDIEKKLLKDKVPYVCYMTDGNLSAQKFAEEITEDGEEVTIAVCGGDGTMNEVVCGISDYSKVTLCCIPTGSSNDLARDFGIPRDPVKMACAALNPEQIVKMDIGRIDYEGGGKNFAVGMGIGFDAAVCREVNKSKLKKILNKVGLGKLSYLGISLKNLFGAKKAGATLILDDGEEIKFNNILMVACMVHRYEGGGFMFCPDADYSDGYLDIMAVGDISKMKVLSILPSAMKGKHTGKKGINMYRAKKVVIRTDIAMAVQVDGESAGFQDEVTVTQDPNQVSFIVS